MTVVAAKVTKASMKEKVKTMIVVPHMLHDPPAHPTLSLEASVSTSGK